MTEDEIKLEDEARFKETKEELLAAGFPFNEFIGLLEGNDAPAQLELGDRFRLGLKLSRNIDLAVHWYKKAADQGCS